MKYLVVFSIFLLILGLQPRPSAPLWDSPPQAQLKISASFNAIHLAEQGSSFRLLQTAEKQPVFYAILSDVSEIPGTIQHYDFFEAFPLLTELSLTKLPNSRAPPAV